MTDSDLTDLLDRATRDIPDPDWAERAWAAAARRRRRQWMGTAGVAAGVAVALGLTVVQLGGPTASVPAASATRSPLPSISGGPYAGQVAMRQLLVTADGTEVWQGPTMSALGALQRSDILPADLVPPTSGPDLTAVVREAAGAASALRVVAVVPVGSGGATDSPFTVWLALRSGSASTVTWARVPGRFPAPNQVLGASPVGFRAIDPTGTKVAIAGQRAVSVVDVRTGAVRALAVPNDPNLTGYQLTDAGYADDGTLVAWGADNAFVAEPRDTALRRVSSGTRPGRFVLSDDQEQPKVLAYAADHTEQTVTTLNTRFGFFGGTAEVGQWLVRGGFPDPSELPQGMFALNGIMAAATDGSRVRILVVPEENNDQLLKGAFVAYGRVPGSPDEVLIGYRTSSRGTIATWNLTTNTLGFVGYGTPAAIRLSTS